MSALSRRGFTLEFADAERAVISLFRGTVVLAAVTYLLGCADEDRVLTARCQVTSDEFAAVAFSVSDAGDAVIGGFSPRQDALGTIFRFMPGHGDLRRARWVPAHTLVTQPASISHEVYWDSRSIHVRLKTDLDGEELPESSRTGIESVLRSGSGLVVGDVERQTIKEVLRAVNEDPRALRLLQEGVAEDLYLVVSSRLLAKAAGLFYAPGGGVWLADGRGSASTPFIAIGTFRIGNTNFHSNYLCEPVDELYSRAASAKTRFPVVYFYTAIRYDPVTKRAERDLRVIDLDLLAATSSVAQIRQ